MIFNVLPLVLLSRLVSVQRETAVRNREVFRSRKTEPIPENNRNKYEDISAEVERLQIKKKNININYPKIKGLEEHAAENRINRLVQQKIYRMVMEGLTSQTGPVNIQSDYKVKLNQRGLLSMLFTQSATSFGAAHPNNVLHSLTIDLESGREWQFDDLFNSKTDYRETLDKLINKQIEERKIPLTDEYKGINKRQEYYLTENMLIPYYQVYKYTYHAYGPLELYIPYRTIYGIINNDGPVSRLIYKS